MRTLLLTAFLGGVLIAGTPLLAHHSFSAEFDINRPIQLSGTVSKVEWINPHAWIYVDVKKRDGTTETWAIETGTPNTLLRRGLRRMTCRRAPRSRCPGSRRETARPRPTAST